MPVNCVQEYALRVASMSLTNKGRCRVIMTCRRALSVSGSVLLIACRSRIGANLAFCTSWPFGVLFILGCQMRWPGHTALSLFSFSTAMWCAICN